MLTNSYDVIVIGGGCSGLSLALELANKTEKKRILIVESRSSYTADRTWCFWNVDSHPFEKIVQHRWDKWKIRYRGEILIQEETPYQYHCIPSENFYAVALEQLNKLDHITLVTDCQVEKIVEENGSVIVETPKGNFNAPIAYDSRPVSQNVGLFQHFLGWKVVSLRPVFNPEEVTLMDFDVSQVEGVNFMYVLPFSSTTALVESTFISERPLPLQIYEDKLKGYLLQRYGLQAFEIVYQERGVLPLETTPIDRSSQLIPIGTRGGCLRSSTGYAFLAIQQQVKELVGQDLKRKSGKIDRYLDKIFLSYLKKNSASTPSLFFNLFKKNTPGRIVRFLTGKASFSDLLNVIWSMPKGGMILEALTVDKSHLFIIHRLVFLLVTLLALNFYPSHWQTGEVVLALLLFFGLGIPHGGLDVALGRSLLKPTLGRKWPLVFFGFYLVSVGLMIYCWLQYTFTIFIFFLAISAFHFGFSDTDKKGRFLYLMEGLARGLVPIALPAYFYSDSFESLVGTVLSQPLADTLTTWASWLFFPTLLFLAFPIIGGVIRRRVGDLLNSIELVALLSLFSFLSPLKAFFIYFCFLHSIRHMMRVSDLQNCKSMKAIVAETLPATLGTLAAMAMAYFFIRQEMVDLNSMVYLFFVALASLTFPHMLVVETFKQRKTKNLKTGL